MVDTGFLFWNTKGKPVADLVGRMAKECEADVIILAESAETTGELVRALESCAVGGARFAAIRH